MLLVNLQLLL